MPEDQPIAGTPLDPGILSGKRRAPRRRCTLAVEVRGAGGRIYAARTVDVSRGGMLLEFTDAQLRAPSQSHELLAFASRLGALFPTGMEVSFGDGAVRTHAKPVRLVASGGEARTHLLGCRFRRPLEPIDCRLLGVDLSGDETDEEPATVAPGGETLTGGTALHSRDEVLALLDPAQGEVRSPEAGPASVEVPSLEPAPAPEAAAARTADPLAGEAAPASALPATGLTDEDFRELNHRGGAMALSQGTTASPVWAPAATVVAHLFPSSQLLVGPRFSGKAVELRTRGVVVELVAPAGEPDAVAWAAGLGTQVRAVFLRQGRVLWEARARVQRLADAGAGVVHAVLLADAPPPPAARRAFGPVGADAVCAGSAGSA